MLAMELSYAVVITDDALARKNAELLGIRVISTLRFRKPKKSSNFIE
jgi:predicted nucleic acid-binding protein